MKPLFVYLSTCDTCKKILATLPKEAIELQDIKKKPVTAEQLDAWVKKTGSYEALFSKRSQLYKQRNLKDVVLSESDYRELILEHYTFLKRPVLVIGEKVWVGNTPEVQQAMQNAFK